MALIPALLYYLGVVWSAYIYSRKDDIPKVEMKVDRRLLLRRTPLFVIPITEIIVLMVIGFSAQYAACWSILTLFIISLFQKDTRPRLGHLFRGLARGAVVASGIAVMCGLIGTIIAMISMTALGVKLATQVELWAHGSLILTLIIAMVVSLLLGMASPVTGSYVIVALIVSPVLMRMGVMIEQAHMFCLYFSVIGYLTPPVAPSAIVAAQMAKASLWHTAISACKICASGFIIPYLFVFDAALLGIFNQGLLRGSLSLVLAILMILSLSALLFNHLFERLNPIQGLLATITVGSAVGYFFTRGNLWFGVVAIASLSAMFVGNAVKAKSHSHV